MRFKFRVLDCILYMYIQYIVLFQKNGSKLDEERAHKEKRTKATVTDI